MNKFDARIRKIKEAFRNDDLFIIGPPRPLGDGTYAESEYSVNGQKVSKEEFYRLEKLADPDGSGPRIVIRPQPKPGDKPADDE